MEYSLLETSAKTKPDRIYNPRWYMAAVTLLLGDTEERLLPKAEHERKREI